MRRNLLAISMLVVLVAGVAPAGAIGAVAPTAAPLVQLNPGPASFRSDNLEYVATLPVDSPGVGARVVQVGDQKRLYVTGVQSLTIYDVTDPGLPLVLGRLELPNWENEDVAVSADGKTVLISEFTGTYLHVIEVLDGPGGTLIPRPVGFHPEGNGHIVSCIDTACDWVYGSEGSIIDLRDKTNPIHLDTGWARQLGLSTGGHNIEIITPSTCEDTPDGVRCPGGIVSADITPITLLDVSNPMEPTIITQSARQDHGANQTQYQHNNKLPLADQYVPRPADEVGEPGLRPGELLMGNGETNFTVDCNSGSGPFATWSAVNWSEGKPMRALDTLRPVSGEYTNGDAAVNALGCSGHWFDWQTDANGDYTVAAAWYEHGTRILHVDSATGEISQKGFYQPVVTSTSAAYWIDDEYIYTADYERGIDILRYSPDAPVPTTAEIDASWLAKLGTTSALAETERYFCKLAQDR
jgi:hypothetical protein